MKCRYWCIFGQNNHQRELGLLLPNNNVVDKRCTVAAFRGMHVLPAKTAMRDHQESVTTGQTDAGQSDPYVPQCFADDTERL